MRSLNLKEENIIKDIRIFFRQIKDRTIKDRTIRDIKNLFEHEEEKENYYKPTSVTIMLNTKVTVIEIKHYQLKNILIKLHTWKE